VELQGRYNELKKSGLGLAVITYDPVPVLAEFASRRAITFPLLSDTGSATIKQYGLLNTSVQPSNPLYGYPFPGTFFLNSKGIVTSRAFEQAYQERNTISSVLARRGGRVDAPATRISAPQLEITSFTTDAAAAPGTRFSVVLDIKPGRRIHVYAPGVSDYRPIALRMEPQPGVVVGRTHVPASEIYLFKPLNERVPVFQRPFRIVQDVMLDPSRAGEAALKGKERVTLSGTLDYQACDDKVCFNPQSVPLSWTVAVKPLDRERVSRQ
jgi:hypothetical protein